MRAPVLFFCHFSYTEQKDRYVWDLKPEYEKKKSRNWDICDRTDHNCGASKKYGLAPYFLAENIAGPGMLRLVEQSMQAQARKTSVTEIAVKERKHPQAALTFDDGPDIRYTPLLLDGLKERNVRVSFFLLGEKVEQYPELVERMQKEGHLVGNHTYHHVQLNKLNETKAREEILKTNNLIYETTGVYPLYLRPPFGAWKKNLELCVEMLPVFWTIDTLDWKVQNTEKIVRTVQEQIEDGAIILMHDEYDTSVEAALQVVDELKNQGYELVTVDQLILP